MSIGKVRRIRFTKAELELISDMAAIASAQGWGEGDYQSWTESTSATFDSLWDKVCTLLARTRSSSV